VLTRPPVPELARAWPLRARLPGVRLLGVWLPGRRRAVPRVLRVGRVEVVALLVPVSDPMLVAPLGETSRVTLYRAPTTRRVSSRASAESIVSFTLVLPFNHWVGCRPRRRLRNSARLHACGSTMHIWRSRLPPGVRLPRGARAPKFGSSHRHRLFPSRPQAQHGPMTEPWTIAELGEELDRFESAARHAGLAEASVRTYVDRSRIFVRWLAGDYQFQGPR
jgi:hypothetical protein